MCSRAEDPQVTFVTHQTANLKFPLFSLLAPKCKSSLEQFKQTGRSASSSSSVFFTANPLPTVRWDIPLFPLFRSGFLDGLLAGAPEHPDPGIPGFLIILLETAAGSYLIEVMWRREQLGLHAAVRCCRDSPGLSSRHYFSLLLCQSL